MVQSRAIVFLIAFLFSFSAFSAEKVELKKVDIDFRQVAIPELSNAVLKGMVQKNYVLASDILTDTRKVTLSVKQVSSDKVLAVFTHLMNGLGVDVIEQEGVIFVEKKAVEKEGVFTSKNELKPSKNDAALPDQPLDQQGDTKPIIYRAYKPLFRSITYLSKIAQFTGSKVAVSDDSAPQLVYSADTDEKLDKTEAMLKTVDTAQSAITIKAALIEYSNTNDSTRSLSGAVSLLAGKLGLAYKAGQSLANGIIFKSTSLSAAIQAIDGDSSFKYLAEPTIRVLNGEKAKLIVGSEVPVRGSSTVDKNGNVIQSVDYKTSGVQFDVMPKINGDIINLYINQQISNFGLTTTSSIDSPTLFKRQAETTLDIKRGSLIMMAGLDETKNVQTSSGLSFLPKFLRSSTKTESKSQILLLLEIVDDVAI